MDDNLSLIPLSGDILPAAALEDYDTTILSLDTPTGKVELVIVLGPKEGAGSASADNGTADAEAAAAEQSARAAAWWQKVADATKYAAYLAAHEASERDREALCREMNCEFIPYPPDPMPGTFVHDSLGRIVYFGGAPLVHRGIFKREDFADPLFGFGRH